jgi:hypothetical protein
MGILSKTINPFNAPNGSGYARSDSNEILDNSTMSVTNCSVQGRRPRAVWKLQQGMIVIVDHLDDWLITRRAGTVHFIAAHGIIEAKGICFICQQDADFVELSKQNSVVQWRSHQTTSRTNYKS